MAEYVNQTLEEMIPELEEMNRLGLFTMKETKIILKRREGHEYKLRQLTKTKESFLNYVEYETKLLELLKVRRKKMGLESGKKGIEKSIADRIHKIFRLLTTRFSECVEFWEMHINFCMQMKEKAYVTRLYERALKLHAHNEDLWVKAARWEGSSHGNSNPHQARCVLLKGQRTNPDSEVLFLQMFLLELQQGKKVAKRKNILLNPEEEEKEDPELGSEFKLAEIVYRSGLSSFPDRPDLHLKVLHLSCAVKEAESLQSNIVADLQRMYPDSAQVWNALALRHLNNLQNMEKDQASAAIAKCVEVYESTVENLGTEEAWTLTLTGLLNLLSLPEANGSPWILQKTLSLFEKSLQYGKTSEDLCISLLDVLSDLGLWEEITEVASRATQLHPSCAQLWLSRLQHESELDGSSVLKLLQTALKHVPAEESWPLWEFCLGVCAAQKTEELEGLMERACRISCPQVCLPAKEWSLHWTFRQGGIKAARNVYKSLRIMRPVSLKFFRIYITIEMAQLEPDLKKIRSAFEEALAEFGETEIDVWLNFIEMERRIGGTLSQGGVVCQRAERTLKPHLRETFIRKQAFMGVEQ